MKKTLSLLLLFVLAWPLSVFGELSDRERSLKYCFISVLVDTIDQDNSKSLGFDPDEYKTAIELRLRSLGIPVGVEDITMETMLMQDCFLYLDVNPLRPQGEYFFAVSVELDLRREVSIGVLEGRLSAATWNKGSIMIVGLNRVDSVKETIVDLVDEFANDYLKANPLEPRSGKGDE